MTERKIIQIAAVSRRQPEHIIVTPLVVISLFALCDDGTLWGLGEVGESNDWVKIKEIPQGESDD